MKQDQIVQDYIPVDAFRFLFPASWRCTQPQPSGINTHRLDSFPSQTQVHPDHPRPQAPWQLDLIRSTTEARKSCMSISRSLAPLSTRFLYPPSGYLARSLDAPSCDGRSSVRPVIRYVWHVSFLIYNEWYGGCCRWLGDHRPCELE